MLIKNLLNQAPSLVGQEINLKGWVKSKRSSKTCSFIALNDGSQFADFQIVVQHDGALLPQIEQIQTGTALEVTGILKQSEGKGQAFEAAAQSIQILGPADPETYPLQKKRHSLEFLRDIAHLRSRTNTFNAVFRMRSFVSQTIHQFFQEEDFHYVHAPVITASDCEGAGDLFSLRKGEDPLFFNVPTYLSVSGQLEAEALALGLGRVYTFGPTFRAENSNTSRHLCEFWMIEPEAAFFTLEDDADLAERLLKFTFTKVLEHCRPELEFFDKFYQAGSLELLPKLATSAFQRVTYSDAVDLLTQAGKKFEYPVSWGIDLQTEHERFLCEEIFKAPVIVTDYPKEIKAFYMKLNPDQKTVRAMDVLVPKVGEIIGGSQREDNLDILVQQMQAFGIASEHLDWYLDLRRFGGAPHAGFGLGLERLLMYITGMQNIRDVIGFPRVPGSAKF